MLLSHGVSQAKHNKLSESSPPPLPPPARKPHQHSTAWGDWKIQCLSTFLIGWYPAIFLNSRKKKESEPLSLFL
jgi:hypothetical protein